MDVAHEHGPVEAAAFERLGTLHERKRREGLDECEAREYEALMAASPSLRTLVDELDREDSIMQATIDQSVDHFDFDRASDALARKLRQDRAQLGLFAGIAAGGTGLVAVGAATSVFEWPLVPVVACAWSVPMVLQSVAMLRRRRLSRMMERSMEHEAKQAFGRHLAMGRHERVLLQAACIMVVVAGLFMLVDALIQRQLAQALVVAPVILTLGVLGWRGIGSRRARQRHERMLTGDVAGSCWGAGKDQDA